MKKFLFTLCIFLGIPSLALAAPKQKEYTEWTDIKAKLTAQETFNFDAHATVLYKEDGLKFNSIFRTTGNIEFHEKSFESAHMYVDVIFKNLEADQNLRAKFDIYFKDFTLRWHLRDIEVTGSDVTDTQLDTVHLFKVDAIDTWHTLNIDELDTELYSWLYYVKQAKQIYNDYHPIITTFVDDNNSIFPFFFSKNLHYGETSYRFTAQRFQLIKLLQAIKVEYIADTSKDQKLFQDFETWYRHVVRHFRYFNSFITGNDETVDQIFGIARYDNPPERLIVLSYKVRLID